MEKQIPHDLSLEKIVLGTILLEPAVFDVVRKYISKDSFYLASHQLIYWSFEQALKKANFVDLAIVRSVLSEAGRLNDAGGSYYISSLTDEVATATNIEVHSLVLAELFKKRCLIKLCHETISNVYDNPDIDEVFAKCSEGIDKIFNLKNTETQIIGKVMEDRINNLSKIDKNKLTGTTTGIANFDANFGGWQNSDLIILAARPSMGKTAVSLYFAKQPVLRQGKRILYFSLEMPAYRLADRLMSLESGISSEALQRADILDKDWLTLYDISDKYKKSHFIINDESGLTIEDITAIAVTENRKNKIDLIIIDYLQLIKPSFKDNRTDNSQVSHISRNCKALAKKLNVPTIALSQLNRSVENRSDKRPGLADLRDSGAIEQDADIVAFLYRDEVYIKETEHENKIEVILSKNRNGRLMTEYLYINEKWSYMSDMPENNWIQEMPGF